MQEWKAASEPDIKVGASMISSPSWEVIIISPGIVVTVSARGAESVLEKHLLIVKVKNLNAQVK